MTILSHALRPMQSHSKKKKKSEIVRVFMAGTTSERTFSPSNVCRAVEQHTPMVAVSNPMGYVFPMRYVMS